MHARLKIISRQKAKELLKLRGHTPLVFDWKAQEEKELKEQTRREKALIGEKENQKKLLELAGKVQWEGDLDEMRENRLDFSLKPISAGKSFVRRRKKKNLLS